MLPATYGISTEYRDSGTDIMTAIHDKTKALLGVSFFLSFFAAFVYFSEYIAYSVHFK